MTYRDDAPSLRAECERLRAENAGLRAEPAPTRYELAAGGAWVATANVCNTLVVVLDAFDGSHGPWRVARAVWCALMWALWALAFVRRVPAAEGARS